MSFVEALVRKQPALSRHGNPARSLDFAALRSG